jgi:hypothetical protein
MLVRFAVHPDVLLTNKEQSTCDPVLVSEHRRLCELWLRYGILCKPSDPIQNAMLWKVILALPPALKTLWVKAAEHGRVVGVPTLNMLGETLPGDVTWANAENVDLICMPDGAASAAPAGALRAMYPEYCEVHEIDFSRAFRGAEEKASQPIRKGMRTGAVWSERFRSLFQTSARVTIVDRYLIRRLLDSRPVNGSAIDHLLQWSGRDAPRCHVKVLTSLVGRGRDTPASTPRECFDAIEGAWQRASMRGRPPASLSVYVIPDRWFSEEVHGRHIRFEDRCVVEIDPGLEVLEREETRLMCTFSLKRLDLSSEHGKMLAKLQETGEKRAAENREWTRADVMERAAG